MSKLIPTYIEQSLRIEQLERELAEAKKDAERYRAWFGSNELDNNIDAAMKEGDEMSDTPRTDIAQHNMGSVAEPHYVVDVEVAHDLERELVEAKKDADRYRWLRDNTCKSRLYEHCGIEGYDTEVMISGEVLDAAIDAAIRKGE